MKNLLLLFTLCISILSCTNKTEVKPVVILPEEWQAIDNTKDSVDILVGHLSINKDTLYIEFDN